VLFIQRFNIDHYMNKNIKTIELNLIKALIEKELNLAISEIKIISNFNNIVYKMITNRGQYILKVITNQNTETYLDYYYFKKLGKLIPEFNQILFSFKKNKYLKRNFIVSKYIEGVPLSGILYKNCDMEIIAENLLKFYKRFNNISVSGYGNATYDFKAPYSSWKEAIESQLIKIEKRSNEFNNYTDRKYTDLLRNSYHLIDRQFEATLFPADFNLNNFILTKESKIKIIESEYYYIGDPLVPYGALLTHIYRTKLVGIFFKKIQNKNLKILSFYAVLEAISVWSFNFMMQNRNPTGARPFGNKNTFHKIIEEFSKNLL